MVIGGWKPGAGRREGMVGSLLLGVQGAEGLEYAGKVGTGFSEQALAELGTRAARPGAAGVAVRRRACRVPDAREAHWVEPVVVGEVRFGEWTRDGRLRHPAWRGLRPDKAPQDVVREDVRDV